MLSQNIIIPLDSASIPSGWSADTSFNGRIVRHSNTGTGATGGSATHTHSSPAHSHQLNNHTHTVSFGYYEEGSGGGAGANADPKRRHNHASVTSSNPTATTYSSSDAQTTGSASSLPPYYAVNFIISSKENLIPANGIVYAQSAKTGLTLCDGNNSTPNLINRFLIGADGGTYTYGSTGGASTHTHAIDHSHASGASHQHNGTSGAYAGDTSSHGGADATDGVNAHTHTFTTGAATAPINSYTGNSGNNTDSSLPPYTSLLPLKNMTGGEIPLQEGIIAMFKGTTLPIGWVLCDGNNGTPNLATNKYVMCGSSVTTGGGSTHTHAAVSHTHTSSAHSHTGNTDNASPSTYQTGDGSYRGRSPHNHTLSTDGITATYANSNYSFNTANNDPPYIEVKFIMATAAALGGGAAVVQNFM